MSSRWPSHWSLAPLSTSKGPMPVTKQGIQVLLSPSFSRDAALGRSHASHASIVTKQDLHEQVLLSQAPAETRHSLGAAFFSRFPSLPGLRLSCGAPYGKPHLLMWQWPDNHSSASTGWAAPPRPPLLIITVQPMREAGSYRTVAHIILWDQASMYAAGSIYMQPVLCHPCGLDDAGIALPRCLCCMMGQPLHGGQALHGRQEQVRLPTPASDL